MYMSSSVFISDSSRLITCVITDRITHSAISSSALGLPTEKKRFRFGARSLLIQILRYCGNMKGQIGAESYFCRARVDIRAGVRGLGRSSAQCTSNSLVVGGGEGMEGREGIVMSAPWRLWTQTSIYLQVSGPSAGSSSARPPLAAFEREEEEGNDGCLATGGSLVIS